MIVISSNLVWFQNVLCLVLKIIIFQTSDDDVSQFDTRFTLQTPIDSPDESTLSESANLMFQVSNKIYLKLSNIKQE